MTEILAELRDATLVYTKGPEPVFALRGVTGKVLAASRIAVMGPSGSGKTSLLHLLAGLVAPTSGQVVWPALGACDGLRPTKIGIAFQAQSLLPALTALENVELPLLLAGRAVWEARVEALELLELTELDLLRDKLPEELSGGQAQRVALVRALVCRPRLVLADEPTGQLDRATAGRLFDIIGALLHDTDTAFIIDTHDPFVAERMTAIWRLSYGMLQDASS